MVMFRSPLIHSLQSDAIFKKTLKFSSKDVIGSGGFGTVYRLTVNDSTAFAVKRLHRGTMEVDRGFERELEAMGDIKHRNIVTLHGYYTSSQYNLLIYELMPNGSLDTFLHGMINYLRKMRNEYYTKSSSFNSKFTCQGTFKKRHTFEILQHRLLKFEVK